MSDKYRGVLITDTPIWQEMNNPANWYKTKKNNYSIWATIVKPGVEVYNQLEDCHYVTDANNCVVLSGTRGEQWVTTISKLASTYYFTNSIKEGLPKRPIDPSNPNSALVDESQIINKTSIMARGKKGVMPWQSITTIPVKTGYTNYCFSLPKYYMNITVMTSWGQPLIANRTEIKRETGLGDFILCSMTPDGQPNLNDIWVVNGDIFISTYNKKMYPKLAKWMKNRDLSKISNKAQKPEKELAVLPKQVNTDSNGNITSVNKSTTTTTKSGGAPRNEYRLVSKFTKNGKAVIAYEVEEVNSNKRQTVDKSALFWLVGRGQVQGVTVQIRGSKIGLLGKDGFSLDSVELKTV